MTKEEHQTLDLIDGAHLQPDGTPTLTIVVLPKTHHDLTVGIEAMS